jgi:hypothetical protein
MRYQIVVLDQNGWGGFDLDIPNVAECIQAMAAQGYRCRRLEDRDYLRSELIGQPVFEGLFGPMYNGEGCIRYENQAAYDAMSN